MTAMRLAAVLLVLALGPQATTQQPGQNPPPPPTGAISGLVLDGATGSPIADAIVSLTGGTFTAGYQTRQITDGKGRFVFQNLPDSNAFQLMASKFGFMDGGYGRDTAPTDALRPIVVKSGAWVASLRVPIWRPSAISGTVHDESGEPVVGVFVRALVRFRIGGREELAAGPMTLTDDRGAYRLSGLIPGRYIIEVPSVQVSVPSGTRIGVPQTNAPEGALDVDDTSRLVIGRYPLPPPRSNGRPMTYSIAFHPNASALAQATAIDLKFGDDRMGIDIGLTPVSAVRVSGLVEGPPEALEKLTLRLLPAGLEGLGHGSEVATALVAGDGSFTFLNVPAGTYTLDAPVLFNEYTLGSGASNSGGSVGFRGNQSFPIPPPNQGWSRSNYSVDAVPGMLFSSSDFRNSGPQSSSQNYSGRTSLTVGTSDMAGVVMRLRPNLTMRGKILMELDPAKPAPETPPRFFVSMDPAAGQPGLGMPRGQTQGPGASDFELPVIMPGEYWIRVSGSGFLVKSILWRGREYAAAPIDTAGADDLAGVVITMTNAVPALSGAVHMSDGSIPESGLVVVFPAAGQRVNVGLSPTRMKSATLQSNGTYRLSLLPAGDYFIAAIDRSRMTTWRDPDFLAVLERTATHISLSWGQTLSQDLTMAVVR